MNVHVVLYLRACTYRYRCLISKICVLLTQIFLEMCIAVCLPGQLVNRYSFCVSDDLFYMLFLCGTVSSMLSGLKTRSLGLNTLGTT